MLIEFVKLPTNRASAISVAVVAGLCPGAVLLATCAPSFFDRTDTIKLVIVSVGISFPILMLNAGLCLLSYQAAGLKSRREFFRSIMFGGIQSFVIFGSTIAGAIIANMRTVPLAAMWLITCTVAVTVLNFIDIGATALRHRKIHCSPGKVTDEQSSAE